MLGFGFEAVERRLARLRGREVWHLDLWLELATSARIVVRSE